MATIGLSNLYYATVTEDTTGDETYGTPIPVFPGTKLITANIGVENAEAKLYGDDALAESATEFAGGTISFGVTDLPSAVSSVWLGARIDGGGVLVQTAEDNAPYVAIGFRAKRSSGKYEYYWLYKVKFSTPSQDFETQGDGITFQTPTIEGTIQARNLLDTFGKHPWKSSIVEAVTTQSVISTWFTEVYEPTAAA